jgi:EAL domain-containing protein (putative c-di-GMP-specific phosphodiesterase class I)
MTSTSLAGFLSAERLPPEGRSPVNAILDAVREHLGMEIAFAARFVDGQRQFTHLSAAFPLPVKPGDGEPREQSYCHHVLEGRLPELIHNAADYPFAQTLPVTSGLPVGCHMDVPLRLSDGRVYGTFCALSRSPDYSLTERDLMTLRAFADLAAGQIEQDLEKSEARAADLRRVQAALSAGEPRMVLQPIHSLATGRPVGAEALARFGDGRAPDLWFAEASRCGVGEKLELAAVRAAVDALPFVPEPLYLSVNASPGLLLSGLLEEPLSQAPAQRLVLEITEHAAIDDYRLLRSALAPLTDRVRLAVDDVGAGYSGLRHILDIGPDILKLDMSLTRDVDHDAARRALIAAMVDFADGIGCRIVAEGIEREGELAVLRDLGVGAGQGWHFSRGLAPAAAGRYLRGEPDAEPAPDQAARTAA